MYTLKSGNLSFDIKNFTQKGEHMPIFFRSDRQSDEPWNSWQNWLLIQSNRKDIFEKAQGGTEGFIICFWKTDIDKPLYLNMVHYSNPRSKNKKLTPKWCQFDHTEQKEDPLQYKSLKKALDVIGELKVACGTDRIGLVYWRHPESHYNALREYQITEGDEFPGSPRS